MSTNNVSLSMQIRLWKTKVQAARRVVALEHRVAKSELPMTLFFSPFSRRLHKQQVNGGIFPEADTLPNLGSVPAGRQESPDIFEVADREESAVCQLPFFQLWVRHESDGTYANPSNNHERMAARRMINRMYREEMAWATWSPIDEDRELENAAAVRDLWLSARPGHTETDSLHSVLVGAIKTRWVCF